MCLQMTPDVVGMIVGVLAGLCDLHIHFQVGVKNHTQDLHWYHRCDLILTHMNKWYVYAFQLLPTIKKSVLLSLTISMLEIIQLSSSATVTVTWVSLIFGRNGSEWQVNLVLIGIALAFWEVPSYNLKQVDNTDGEQQRTKAGSLCYSNVELFLFWKKFI